MDIKIFIINLASSTKRKEAMIEKIKNIKDFDIFIDDVFLDLHFDGFVSQKNTTKIDTDGINHTKIANSTAKSTIKPTINNTTNPIANTTNHTNPATKAKEKTKNQDSLYFYFYPAIVASDIENKTIKIPNYKESFARFVRGKGLSFGEIAVFSSHYNLWHKVVELDCPLIILEDDVLFSNDFKNIIHIFHSPFEYVRLMCLFDKKMFALRKNFFISFERISGTQGYYITPSAAKKLIKKAKYFFHCVDDYMDMFFLHNVLNIIYKPFLISEDTIESSTINDRHKTKVNKFTRELSRIYLFVWKKYLFLLFNLYRILKQKRNV